MVPEQPAITVVGGGLAGCEAALQLARLGLACTLVEMRPEVTTPAHTTARLAEVVCSNSLKSTAESTASGVFKAELDRRGCRLLELARSTAVPAGAALAIDREAFSNAVEAAVAAEPQITLLRAEVTELDERPNHLWIVATGPLTGDALAEQLGRITGQDAA